MNKVFDKPIAEFVLLSSDEIMGTDDVISGDIVDYKETETTPNVSTQSLEGDEF